MLVSAGGCLVVALFFCAVGLLPFVSTPKCPLGILLNDEEQFNYLEFRISFLKFHC